MGILQHSQAAGVAGQCRGCAEVTMMARWTHRNPRQHLLGLRHGEGNLWGRPGSHSCHRLNARAHHVTKSDDEPGNRDEVCLVGGGDTRSASILKTSETRGDDYLHAIRRRPNFVCQSARASLGKRLAGAQEAPGHSTRPGGVGPRGQKPFSDKHFHEAITWRPHASWP
jgi:hypothetical protein